LFEVDIDEYGLVLYGDGNREYWNRIVPENMELIKHILFSLSHYAKIVGNIHENLELLEARNERED